MRVDRLSEQPGLPFAGRQQSREHLHRRGLAAAVRPEETEDLAAADFEVDVIDGDEVPKALGQVLSLDGDLAVVRFIARRDFDEPVTAALLFGEQGDKGRLH